MNIAVAVAEQAERAGGPRAGLFAWKKLAENATTPEIRGKALLSAFRCALALRDAAAVRDLVQAWSAITGEWDGPIAAYCKDLARAGLAEQAAALAATEAQRKPTARSIYLHARCLELAGDGRAAMRYAEAIARAAREEATDRARASADGARERAARVRRAAVLFRTPEGRTEALREAQRVDPKSATPDERLVLARVLLSAPSRFVRSTGLGMLDELVMADSPLVPDARTRATKARRIAARHADDFGDKLTPMEIDRLLAIFSRGTPRAHGAMKALAALSHDVASGLAEAQRASPELAPLHKRAKDILEDRFAPGGDGAWDRLLDVVTAMRQSSPGRVARALEALAAMPELPPQTWTVLQAALAMNEAEITAPAAKLAKRLFGRTPPRGWLAVATSLGFAGLEELATDARRQATAAGEPGAAEALGIVLTRSAWQLASNGERTRAMARLREAKALAQAQEASSPPPKASGSNPST